MFNLNAALARRRKYKMGKVRIKCKEFGRRRDDAGYRYKYEWDWRFLEQVEEIVYRRDILHENWLTILADFVKRDLRFNQNRGWLDRPRKHVPLPPTHLAIHEQHYLLMRIGGKRLGKAYRWYNRMAAAGRLPERAIPTRAMPSVLWFAKRASKPGYAASVSRALVAASWPW